MSRSPELISALPAHDAIAVRHLSPCDASHPVGDVVHDHSGLGLYLSGTTRMWMGIDYVLARGDVLLIPEGMPHCSSATSSGELLGVMLCTACMREAWGEWLRDAFDEVRRGAVALRRLTEGAIDDIEQLITSLADELENPRPQHELMVDGLMSQLTAQIARAAPAKLSPNTTDGCPPLIADALEYIEKNASAAISLSDVAQAVSRSPAHLATTMKQHTGRTVVEWITHGRMALARQLLLSSDEAIESVAEHVGYASASHFHRTFRQLHDASPGEWRQAHR